MIGIFDSGIGGLTVTKEIKKVLPNLKIIYFGDTARYPWGNKSPETIQRYSDEITQFLLSKGVKNIVIACNTASTFATDFLNKKYHEINFYDVISPVIDRIKKESEEKENLKIGIIGTRGTISSGIYENKINELGRGIKVYSKARPLFVPLVEERYIESDATKIIAEEYLKDLKNDNLNYLVLGCTHYPLLKNVIKNVVDVEIISSAEEIAFEISTEKLNGGYSNLEDEYYFSDITLQYEKFAEEIMGQKLKIKKLSF